MIQKLKTLFLAGLCLLTLGCLWDYDTIEMERQRFPSVLELISGKFLRHSAEFYQWRIKDRTEKLAKAPDKLEYYDDLAVAYDSVSNRAKAIEVMLEKEKKKPGLYETYANLGTFYIHDGKLEEGVEYIKKAIQINPDAHFGREVYQQLLVEYILEKRDAEKKLKLPVSTEVHGENFSTFALSRRPAADESKELEKQLKGLLGIMKFSNYRNPILLEAVGHSLLANNRNEQRLVACAFLRASYEVKNEESRAQYRAMAKSALSMQSGETVENVEVELKAAIQEADSWYAGVRADELRWIEEGGDVDAKFSAKYYTDPELSTNWLMNYTRKVWNRPEGLVLVLCLGVIGVYLVLKIRRKRRLAI